MCESSSCAVFLSTFDIVSLFNFSHSSECVVVSYCGFNLHFFKKTNDVEHLFVCLSAIPISSLVKICSIFANSRFSLSILLYY